MADNTRAEIGILGGSGFEHLLDEADYVDIETPWGKPAAAIAVGDFAGRRIAFMPRHGMTHEFPPHTVPYRANIWAMKELGVDALIGPAAAGSLQRHIAPGDFVICDQLVDRTKNRGDTFFDGSPSTHISFADPYCSSLRPLTIEACEAAGVVTHTAGTVAVIEGPRFSTRSESAHYSEQGWEVINMTQHPEATLAREAEICYVNISLITDYDTGFSLDSGIDPVSAAAVIEVFNHNNERVVKALEKLVAAIPDVSERTCGCPNALDGAQL